MPFIYEKNIINQFDFNKELYRIKSGVDINIFNNSTLSLGFESLKLEGNLDYTLYLGESLPSDIKIPMYLYTIERDNNTQIINYISLSFNSRLSENFESNINFLNTIFDENQVFQPLYIIDISNSYSSNNFSLTLGGNFELESYGLNYKNELFEMKSFIDIYLDSSYEISKNLNLNLSISNILNRYNERFYICLLYTSPSPRDRG